MLTTQIGGLFQRLIESNEASIEETARLLAQATIGEGKVIFAGLDDLSTIYTVSQNDIDPFEGAIPYETEMTIHTSDRVWLISKSAKDPRALELARSLSAQFIPFAAIAPEKEENNELFDLASTYISTGLMRGLLPGDDGKRILQPHALANLFIYEAVKIAYDEMLVDE